MNKLAKKMMEELSSKVISGFTAESYNNAYKVLEDVIQWRNIIEEDPVIFNTYICIMEAIDQKDFLKLIVNIKTLTWNQYSHAEQYSVLRDAIFSMSQLKPVDKDSIINLYDLIYNLSNNKEQNNKYSNLIKLRENDYELILNDIRSADFKDWTPIDPDNMSRAKILISRIDPSIIGMNDEIKANRDY